MPPHLDARLDGRAVLRAALVCGVALVYTGLFWFQPLSELAGFRHIYAFMDQLVADALTALGYPAVRGRVRWAFSSAIFVLVPLVALWIAGRPPTALGLGRMARQGWRIVALGFALALPFLFYLGLSAEMQRYYASFVRAGGGPDVLASAFVVLVEHLFIEGLVLALALPSGGLHAFDEPPRAGKLACSALACRPASAASWPGSGSPPAPGRRSSVKGCSSAWCTWARPGRSSGRRSPAASASAP